MKKKNKKGNARKPVPARSTGPLALPAWSVLLLFAILGALLYANTLQAPLVFDDETSIRDNSNIRLESLSLSGLLTASRKNPAPHRPLAYVSFALNHLVHGYRLPGYHLVNIAVHILTGFLLFLLIRGTLALPLFSRRFGHPDLLALFAALLWFANPLQTQSVTYVVQRMNSMAAMFYILALLLYLYGRQRIEDGLPGWPCFAGCAAAGVLACATKEIAATLPLMILLYEFFFLQDLDRGWVRRALPWITGVVAVLLLIGLLFLGGNPVDRVLDSYEHRDFTMTQRLLTEPRVVLDYLGLFILPLPGRLNLDHQVVVSHSLMDPSSTLPALLTLAGLLIAVPFLARRWRIPAFAIFWFLGNLVIESSVIALELMFEHRAYLPTMFIPLALLTLVWPLFKRPKIAAAVFTVLTLLLSAWTWQRNSVWSGPLTLWQDVARKSPLKARPHNNLSAMFIDSNRVGEALHHAGLAVRLEPENADAHYNLGTALLRAGRIEEAVHSLEESLRIDPEFVRARTNLGGICFHQGHVEQALGHWEEALRIDPSEPLANYNSAVQYEKRGQYDRAIIHFRRYLEHEDDAVETRMRVAALLERQGWREEAAAEYRTILKTDPHHGEAQTRLAALEKRSQQ